MKTDLISLFNQLTSSELADCNFKENLFDELLSNHYEKIKYLYSLMSGVNIRNEVDELFCYDYDYTKMSVIIVPRSSSTFHKIIKKMNANRNNYFYSKLLFLEIKETEDRIEVEISTLDDRKEDSFYENRII